MSTSSEIILTSVVLVIANANAAFIRDAEGGPGLFRTDVRLGWASWGWHEIVRSLRWSFIWGAVFLSLTICMLLCWNDSAFGWELGRLICTTPPIAVWLAHRFQDYRRKAAAIKRARQLLEEDPSGKKLHEEIKFERALANMLDLFRFEREAEAPPEWFLRDSARLLILKRVLLLLSIVLPPLTALFIMVI